MSTIHLKSLCEGCQSLALQAGAVKENVVVVNIPADDITIDMVRKHHPNLIPDNAYGIQFKYITPPDTSEVDQLLVDLRAEVDRFGAILDGDYEIKDGKIVRRKE